MQQHIMTVSKKEDKAGKGEYVEVGKVTIFYPMLSDFGIEAALAKDDKGEDKKDEEGFPIYADDKAQYLFDCCLANAKAQARNKLISGTATVKDGQAIAETLEQLMASGAGNRGEALAIIREMLAALKAWLPTTGKSQTVQDIVMTLASKSDALAISTPQRKANFLELLTAFVAQLKPEQAVRFARPLGKLEEAASKVEQAEDF